MKKISKDSPFGYKRGQVMAQPLQLSLFTTFAKLQSEQRSRAVKRGLAHKKMSRIK